MGGAYHKEFKGPNGEGGGGMEGRFSHKVRPYLWVPTNLLWEYENGKRAWIESVAIAESLSTFAVAGDAGHPIFIKGYNSKGEQRWILVGVMMGAQNGNLYQTGLICQLSEILLRLTPP